LISPICTPLPPKPNHHQFIFSQKKLKQYLPKPTQITTKFFSQIYLNKIIFKYLFIKIIKNLKPKTKPNHHQFFPSHLKGKNTPKQTKPNQTKPLVN